MCAFVCVHMWGKLRSCSIVQISTTHIFFYLLSAVEMLERFDFFIFP